MQEIKVDTLYDFIKEIVKIKDALINNKTNKNEIMLFRGHEDKNYEILPSLARNRKSATDITIFNEERNLIEMAQYILPDMLQNNMSPLEKLALLQHYGIPTRLLDITENAFVALYFACIKEDQDGEVIIFVHNELDVASYPIIQAVADSYRLIGGSSLRPLELFYDSALNQPYFLEHLNSCKICDKTDEDKSCWVEECWKNPQIVYAPIRTLRQQVQGGRYILFPNKIIKEGEKKYFVSLIEKLEKDSPMIKGRIIIPKENKKEILNQLSLCGITEAALFCDNTDIKCRGIVNKFKNKIH